MVSIYELRARLLPLMVGIPWAEDALMDLWKMGAPDPATWGQVCPPGTCASHAQGKPACGKWGCARERRLLLPTQFATWWRDVATRQGLSLTPSQALKLKRN
jgi:hypothetical protein